MSCTDEADELPSSPPNMRKGLPSTISWVAVPCLCKAAVCGCPFAVNSVSTIRSKIIRLINISINRGFMMYKVR